MRAADKHIYKIAFFWYNSNGSDASHKNARTSVRRKAVKRMNLSSKEKKEFLIFASIGTMLVLCNAVFAAEISWLISAFKKSDHPVEKRPVDSYFEKVEEKRRQEEEASRVYDVPSGGKKSGGAYYPDVSGYSDPEEFYYWHPDDFYDFEDAEDYYYEHGGE